eukprot:CAMPEP_0174332580 /NCGR_PEP_ID=MMETSP0810-20121108/18426_1 /TAXON_ID=73025 ORGANISM="Eutreptiella gymnastica-like, Strain CCMP1594" /NCGR_SAMPLE_ID=MMETSP0810 /ASSEMBLY_ACC=CAM_ASM_000659 /LENGTH=41 /DNA_ID= /DNA_START= /DNA_END= /DNA_ORIENTATION=
MTWNPGWTPWAAAVGSRGRGGCSLDEEDGGKWWCGREGLHG